MKPSLGRLVLVQPQRLWSVAVVGCLVAVFLAVLLSIMNLQVETVQSDGPALLAGDDASGDSWRPASGRDGHAVQPVESTAVSSGDVVKPKQAPEDASSSDGATLLIVKPAQFAEKASSGDGESSDEATLLVREENNSQRASEQQLIFPVEDEGPSGDSSGSPSSSGDESAPQKSAPKVSAECSSASDTEKMGSMDHNASSAAAAPPVPGGSGSESAPAVDKAVDFANYFHTYGFLYHQKEMLADRVRMEAYYDAVFDNADVHFRDKVVLDVGTGSGILAIWCAQAGAKKVYAVEATKMSEHARGLVKANQVGDIVEVIHGSMEDVILPEKVDVIISEWMGYFLLREYMFDSVICARDRWLKPNGIMYPSHARMWVAPIRSGLVEQKKNEHDSAMADWYSFVDEAVAHYGVNMSVLTESFHKEHEKFYLQTSMWNNLHPNQIIGTSAVVKEIDCLKATVDEIRNVKAQFSPSIDIDRTQISGFAGWFDVHFRGNEQYPAKHEVELTTAPSVEDSTHWGQQVFLLHPPLRVNVGDKIEVSFTMNRSKQYHRLMDVEFTTVLHKSSGKSLRPVTSKFYME